MANALDWTARIEIKNPSRRYFYVRRPQNDPVVILRGGALHRPVYNNRDPAHFFSLEDASIRLEHEQNTLMLSCRGRTEALDLSAEVDALVEQQLYKERGESELPGRLNEAIVAHGVQIDCGEFHVKSLSIQRDEQDRWYLSSIDGLFVLY